MKYGLSILVLILATPVVFAEVIENNRVDYAQTGDTGARNTQAPRPGMGSGGRPGFGGHRFGGRGHFGGHRPSEAERQAFESCMAQQGVQLPARPQLSDEQKAALENCHSQSQDPQSFHSCMQSAGITPPPHPQFDSKALQALQVCRSQAKGQQ